MRNIRFLTLAETEIDDAVFWYQNNSQDESLKFLAELDRALQIITAFPRIATEIETGVRCFPLRRFPYSLLYGLDGSLIVVIAIAHQSPKPRYWLDRMQ